MFWCTVHRHEATLHGNGATQHGNVTTPHDTKALKVGPCMFTESTPRMFQSISCNISLWICCPFRRQPEPRELETFYKESVFLELQVLLPILFIGFKQIELANIS